MDGKKKGENNDTFFDSSNISRLFSCLFAAATAAAAAFLCPIAIDIV